MAIRYTGHPDGVEVEVPVGNGGEFRILTIAHGDEIPTEIAGQKVPDDFLKGLLAQPANWTEAPASKPTDDKGGK